MEQYPLVKMMLNFRLKNSLSSENAFWFKNIKEIINAIQVVTFFFVDFMLANL